MPWDFDLDTRARLLRDGWRPQRAIALGAIERAWAEDGYPPAPAAVAGFARAFAGLRLRTADWRGDGEDAAVFDPVQACRNFDPAWARDYQAAAGTVLLPVGQAFSAHLTVLAGADGGLYGGYDDSFWRLGECIEPALAALYAGGRGRLRRLPLGG